MIAIFVCAGIVLFAAASVTVVFMMKKNRGNSKAINKNHKFNKEFLSVSETSFSVEEGTNNGGRYTISQFYNPVVRSLSFDNGSMKMTVTNEGIVIGRAGDCQLRFPNHSRGISRYHCRISFDRNLSKFILKDLNSSYGTFLKDGIRIPSDEPTYLSPGMSFYLGCKKNIMVVELEKRYDFG